MRRRIVVWATFFTLLASVTVNAIEKPVYKVVHAASNYEIRLYEAYLVAETDVEGEFSDAGNTAFGILAGYIFGDNAAREKMKMTAPVESRSAEKTPPASGANDSRKPDDVSTFTYGFVMERRFTMDTLPNPTDDRVRIRRVDPRHVAVLRYSGRWTEENYHKHRQALFDALEKDDISIVGEPILARYNPPIMPWFMRRNEVMVEVRWDKPAKG